MLRHNVHIQRSNVINDDNHPDEYKPQITTVEITM